MKNYQTLIGAFLIAIAIIIAAILAANIIVDGIPVTM